MNKKETPIVKFKIPKIKHLKDSDEYIVIFDSITNQDEAPYVFMSGDEFHVMENGHLRTVRGKQYQTKPPIGFKPSFLWIEERIKVIEESINKRVGTDHKIPQHWITERNYLIDLHKRALKEWKNS